MAASICQCCKGEGFGFCRCKVDFFYRGKTAQGYCLFFVLLLLGVFVVVVAVFSCRRKCVHFQRRNVTAATLDLWQRLPVPLAVSATIRDLSLQSKYTFAAANLPSNVQALQKQPNF